MGNKNVLKKLESFLAQLDSKQNSRKEQETSKTLLESDLESIKEILKISHDKLESEIRTREESEASKTVAENSLSELQKQLDSQKGLTRKYFHALSKTKKEQIETEETIRQFQNYSDSLLNDFDSLQNDLDSLLNSKRWRTGNFLIRMLEIILLRKKQPMPVDHMQQIFDALNINGPQKQNPPSNRQTIKPANERFKFKKPLTEDSLMRQLENDVQQLSTSTRWKVSNAVIRLINTMLLRKKQPMPLDHMQDIIKEYKNIKSTLQNISPELTQRWERNLKSDLEALLASKCWQIGNSLVRLTEIILLRKKQPMAIDHMQALFKHYDQSLNKDNYNNWYEEPVQENYYPPEPAPSPQPEFSSPALNILLVSHSRINSNSGYHVEYYAQMLARQNISCIIAVPRIENGDNPQNRSFQVCTYDDCTNKTLTFPNGKGPDIVHAWTPREHVRKFCQNLENKYNFKTIIHLEDNEEYLTESALRKPCEELKTLTLEELDSIIPQNRFHPVRGWEWLKKAHGLTMIIATLHRFNPSGLPSTILQAPVDDRFFYPRPINHGLRERLNIPENHIVLCYTGDIRAPKKQEVLELYRAIELLNQQGFPTTLIRTGTNFLPLDPDESRYKDFEKNLGWVSRHEVADIMAAADILIQPGWPGPFDDERLPAKLPEYFAMGRPIILPRTNLGLKVEHLKEGYVLDRADAENITRAVIEINKDKEMAGKMAVGGAAFYRTWLNKNMSKELLDFYTSLIKTNSESN